jgi:hypothetical protein
LEESCLKAAARSDAEKLLFEAGTGWLANLVADGAVVRPGLGQSAIAPAMGRMLVGRLILRLGRGGGDEHRLRAKVLAESGLAHN